MIPLSCHLQAGLMPGWTPETERQTLYPPHIIGQDRSSVTTFCRGSLGVRHLKSTTAELRDPDKSSRASVTDGHCCS